MMKNLILSSYMTRKLVTWKLSEISHGATFINRPGSGMYGIKFWREIRKSLTVVMCGSLFSVLSCNSCMWRQAIGWPISARNSPFGNPRISTTTWKSNNLDDLRSNKNQIINESWSKLFFCKTLRKTTHICNWAIAERVGLDGLRFRVVCILRNVLEFLVFFQKEKCINFGKEIDESLERALVVHQRQGPHRAVDFVADQLGCRVTIEA